MSGSLKLGLYILAVVIVGWIGFHIVTFILARVLTLVIMLAIGLVIVNMVSRKALGGSRRTLP